MAALYLHIPFCKQACYYCDFHFSTNQQLRTALINALIKEIKLQKDFLKGEVLNSIYFGGGTPSLLSIRELDDIFKAVFDHYKTIPDPEITLECNPDDLKDEKLDGLFSLGINRLSIGIQSFNDDHLRFLHRSHSSDDSNKAFLKARSTGFENISIDLIFGIPSNSNEIWINDLQSALELHPEHISAYCLTIEHKTVFGNWVKKGKMPPVDEELSASQFEMLMDTFESTGYEQYEISNFSLPNYYSRHNTNYWKHLPYLGLGPGAHSFDGHSRYFNVQNNSRYIKAVSNGDIPNQKEILTIRDLANEYLMTSLRTSGGCNLEILKSHYDYPLIVESGSKVNKWLSNGYLKLNNQVMTLTSKGKLVADEITADLYWV